MKFAHYLLTEPIRCNSEIKGVFDTYEGALSYVKDEFFETVFPKEKYEWEYLEYDKCWHAFIEGQESNLVYKSADRCVKIEAHWLRNDDSDFNYAEDEVEGTLEGGANMSEMGDGATVNGKDDSVEVVDLTS